MGRRSRCRSCRKLPPGLAGPLPVGTAALGWPQAAPPLGVLAWQAKCYARSSTPHRSLAESVACHPSPCGGDLRHLPVFARNPVGAPWEQGNRPRDARMAAVDTPGTDPLELADRLFPAAPR